jgi:hypothetical protein
VIKRIEDHVARLKAWIDEPDPGLVRAVIMVGDSAKLLVEAGAEILRLRGIIERNRVRFDRQQATIERLTEERDHAWTRVAELDPRIVRVKVPFAGPVGDA